MTSRPACSTRALLWMGLLLCSACGPPLGPLPGGRLSGEVVAPPADWTFTNAHDTVQLETNPADPYSVNIWGTRVGDSFYVAAGEGGEATWAQHIEADPNVRLGVGGNLYELRAVRIDLDDEPETRAAFLAALQQKYDFDAEEDERSSEAWLYRLDPR